MTRSALLASLALAGLAAVASAQSASSRGPQCGVFDESHGRVTVVSSGTQFSLPQLIGERRFTGTGPGFGCWVEIGTSDDLRGTFMYGYRVTDPSGESKEFGPAGIEIGGFGSTGGIPVPLYKKPDGAWRVEFYTVRRDNAARASLGSASFTVVAGPLGPVAGKATGRESVGSIRDAPAPPPAVKTPPQDTVSTVGSSGALFEDRFASPDANTPGPRWREYTLRRNTVRAEESPWRINNNSLSFEALGTGEYIEDLVETVDTFPIDNVRVEFEFRGEAATAKGYVGPTVWWSADARNLSGAGNVSTGPPLIGVQATYRWENRGTRGVTINVGGVMKDHPDAIFAGLNEPRFARHVLTIANGRVTYESAGFPAVSYPLASPPRPGERRHLAFGARVYDAGDVQVLQFRNLKITALGGGGTLTTGPPSQPPGERGLRTGPAVQVLSASVPVAGGTLSVQRPGDPLDRFTIEVPPNSYPATRRFAVSYEPIVGHTLGRSVTPISPLITVDNGGALADAMMKVTVPVKVPEGYFAMGFFVDPRSGKLEGMPLLAIGREAITVATRHFSSFLVSMIPLAELDQSILSGMIDSGFRPGLDDWEFPNLGSYIEPDGHCAGQSLSALWYFVNRPDGAGVHLWNRYDRNGARPATPEMWEDDSRAYRLASVVQKDINWGRWEFRLTSQLSGLGDQMTLRAFAYAITATGEPQNVGIHSAAGGGHNMMAYLVKDGTLYIADPNYPGDNNRRIVFDHATGRFKPYNSGANAADIAAGHGQDYETIIYQAKSATFDWAAIGRRWGEMQAGSIGTSLFPGYQLYWVNEQGQPTPLTEGAVLEQTYVKFAFKVTGAAESAALIYLNGAPAEKSVNGMYELRPGRNEVGVGVFGKRTAAESDFAYVDFKYVNVSSAATPVDDPKPDNDDNLCAGVLELAASAGMSPTAYYRAQADRAKAGQEWASMSMVLCNCPIDVNDVELLACLNGEPVAAIEPNPCAGFTLADFKNGNRSLAFMKCALKCGGPVSNQDGTPGGPPKSDAAIQACMEGKAPSSKPPPPKPRQQ